MLVRIRAYFAQQEVLEVETPALSHTGSSDPHIESLHTMYRGPGAPLGTPLYLHTSPEFAMKRLLAAGSGSIYQICKVFRDGEYGRRHNPEFTLLEWYRVGWDYHQLMHEVASLIAQALAPLRALAPAEYISYRDAFQRFTDIDGFGEDARLYAAAAQHQGIAYAADADIDTFRDLLLTHTIEPQLGHNRVTMLYDYPASQAALARIRDDATPVAERFEAYLDGIELANGFTELLDAPTQRARFVHDNACRARAAKAEMPMDTRLLAAMQTGLPACAGVALGIDRLAMVALGKQTLSEVLTFPLERA